MAQARRTLKKPTAGGARRVRERPLAPAAVLVDANVIFDVLLFRAPWYSDAVVLFEALADGRLRGLVAVHTVTTLWYVLRRELGAQRARTAVSRLLSLLVVAPLDRDDLQRALSLPLGDFEDSCQVVAAERAGADAIVTRDARHFRGSPIPTLTPAHLLARLGVA